MTGTLVFLGAGAALLLLLVLSWRGDSELELEEPDSPSDPAVMRQIIAPRDMAYVASLGMPKIQRFFVRERRRLALDWLRASRKEACRLLYAHAEAAKRSRDIRPMMEIRIACLFASFFLLYLAMAGLVRLFGPFRTPALLRSGEYLFTSLESLGRAAAGRGLLERQTYPA
jgi:hypothetical protein